AGSSSRTPPTWLCLRVNSRIKKQQSSALFRMRRTDVRKLLQNVGVGLETCGWTLIFRQEGKAVIDHVVSEHAAVGILRGLGRIETYHVGKCALRVDRSNRFLACVVAGMPHQMHELLEPSLAVVGGLARVVLLLSVIRVEEAANAGMSGAIDVEQLAVPSYTASPPDVDLGFGIEFTGRQLDHSRKHVCSRIRIDAGPWRFVAEMRLSEVPFAPGIEQILDSVEIEKERVASAACEKSVETRLDDIRIGAEGDLGVGDYFRPDRFGRARLRALRREHSNGLLAVLRL